jgi:hypothetical protein
MLFNRLKNITLVLSLFLMIVSCGGGGGGDAPAGDGTTTAGDGTTTAGDGTTTAGDGTTTAGDGKTTDTSSDGTVTVTPSDGTVVDDAEITLNNLGKAVISAIATSNTTVIVSFHTAMSATVESIDNYSITQENINSEVGKVLILDAVFVAGSNNLSVELTTTPQNEVFYRLRVSGVNISTGESLLASIELATNQSDAINTLFAGTAPGLQNLTVVAGNGSGGISGEWIDSNENNLVDNGDYFQNGDGSSIELSDFTGDGLIDNWVDTDNNGAISVNDIVTGFQDSDGDGMPDNVELYGVNIQIKLANGEVQIVSATSSPILADTDGDGLSDNEELGIGSNPRSTDTDGDGISDYFEFNVSYSDTNMQDTDLDGIADNLEHDFYHTSLLLADTDGDQLSDYTEIFELNRNPRIADLPNFSFRVGEVRLQIDEKFSYTDESGQSVTQESSSSTSLSNSENTSFARSNGGMSETTHDVSIRAGFGTGNFYGGDGLFTAGVEVTGGFSDTNSTSWQSDSASAKESQKTIDASIARGKEFNTSSTVTREIVGARIDIDIMLFNSGTIPFNVSNIEITVLEQTGILGKFLPVATLVSNSELITGNPFQVNLGSFNSEHGPFIFASRDVFPNLVEALMRNPTGLMFRVANYDISDELGRNYSFASQTARDRTAGIILDYGDAEAAERFLVATNGAQDSRNDAVNAAGAQYVGGFNAVNGLSIGLPINYVLQNIMGLRRHDTALDTVVAGADGTLQTTKSVGDAVNNGVISAGADGWLESRPIGDDFIYNPTAINGIVAGLNKTADSRAQGDDVQLIPVGTTGISIGSIVIDPGENQVLDTMQLEDDSVDFVGGYETSKSCSATSNKAGDICRVASDCSCQAENETEDPRCPVTAAPVPTGSCTGPQRLVRVNSLRNGDYNRGWRILTTGVRPDAADFDLITVDPGKDITLAFLQDLDKDGLFARNEFLLGSTDSSRDQAYNAAFSFPNIDPTCPSSPLTCDGIPDSRDSDQDGLSDFAEANVGWKVSFDGGALRQVFSSPRFDDTDGDGLLDRQEKDLSGWCNVTGWDGFDDPRVDGLCAFQSAPAVQKADAIGILAGPNGVAESQVLADDVEEIPYNQYQFDDNFRRGALSVTPGTDGEIQTILGGDDIYISGTATPPASDPSSRDTDQDGLSDYEELEGVKVALAIVDGGNGIAESTRNGDDIQRAYIDNPVFPNSIIILPGDNGFIDSLPGTLTDDGDDVKNSGFSIDCGINLRVDTHLRGDDEYLDYFDGDGIAITYSYGSFCGAKNNVISPGPNGIIDSIPNTLPGDDFIRLAHYVATDPLRRDTDGDQLIDGYEFRIGSDPTVIDGDEFIDSDQDGLTDKEENSLGWLVSVNGGLAITVKSSPSLPDTDFDGVPDFIERDLRTNPNNHDTDNDGISDYDEIIDFSKYTTLAAIYPGMNVPANNPNGYGTSPILSDTDGDQLTDKQELIDGFRLSIRGILGPVQVYTNALYADTDLDGINDNIEMARVGGPTNPVIADTDSDGRSDFEELLAGTNPHVIDRKITIRYSSMQLKGGLDEWSWDLYSQLAHEASPGIYMADAAGAENVTAVTTAANVSNCGDHVSTGNLQNIIIDKQRQFYLSPGGSITLHGVIRERTDCANVTTSTCTYGYRKTFEYDAIASGGSGSSGVITTTKWNGITCANPDIVYDIIVN